MRIYSVYENEQWIGDMTADEIAVHIGCSRRSVLNAVATALLIKGRYGIVYDGDNTVTGNTSADKKMLREFDQITKNIRKLASV